jgi:hypothetical protein
LPNGVTVRDLILRGDNLASVEGDIAISADPLTGLNTALNLRAADVHRRSGFGTIAGATNDCADSRSEGSANVAPCDWLTAAA